MLFRTIMRKALPAVAALALFFQSAAAFASSILFIGNSFTFAAGSPVQQYHPESVTDLNGGGIGGVPALFKSFTAQAGLKFDVSLETAPGMGLDYHYKNKAEIIGKPWDYVVMHGFSTLDQAKPGDPAIARQVRQAGCRVAVREEHERGHPPHGHMDPRGPDVFANRPRVWQAG